MSNSLPKYIIALKQFHDRAEQGMFELEALQAYGDTCLHSTVSSLVKKGICFRRHPHYHTHRNGGQARFIRYVLMSRGAAEKLLAPFLDALEP